MGGGGHRRQCVYNIVPVHENDEARRAENRSSKAEHRSSKAEDRGSKGRGRWGSLGGHVPLPTRWGLPGEHCKLPSGVRGRTPATRRFRTFYRLTKPFLVSSRFCQTFSGGPSHRMIEDPVTKFFLGSDPPDTHSIGHIVEVLRKKERPECDEANEKEK